MDYDLTEREKNNQVHGGLDLPKEGEYQFAPTKYYIMDHGKY